MARPVRNATSQKRHGCRTPPAERSVSRPLASSSSSSPSPSASRLAASTTVFFFSIIDLAFLSLCCLGLFQTCFAQPSPVEQVTLHNRLPATEQAAAAAAVAAAPSAAAAATFAGAGSAAGPAAAAPGGGGGTAAAAAAPPPAQLGSQSPSITRAPSPPLSAAAPAAAAATAAVAAARSRSPTASAGSAVAVAPSPSPHPPPLHERVNAAPPVLRVPAAPSAWIQVDSTSNSSSNSGSSSSGSSDSSGSSSSSGSGVGLSGPSPPTSGEDKVKSPLASVPSSFLTSTASSSPPIMSLASSSASLASAVARICSDWDRLLIVVRAATSEQLLLRNWLASIMVVGYSSLVLFLAQDTAMYDALRSQDRWRYQVVLMHDLQEAKINGSKDLCFPCVLHALLNLNVTLVYTRPDTVWLSDPFIYTHEGYDALAVPLRPDMETVRQPGSHFRQSSGNGLKSLPSDVGMSFLLLRPTPGGLELVRQWKEIILSQRRKDSQAALQLALKGVKLLPKGAVSLGLLPIYWFPTGSLYFSCSDDDAKNGFCRPEYAPLQNWYAAQLRTGFVKPAVVHDPLLIDSEDMAAAFATAGASKHAVVAELLSRHNLWFEPDYSNLMQLGSSRLPALPTAGVAADSSTGAAGWAGDAVGEVTLPETVEQRSSSRGLTLKEAVENVCGPERVLVFCSASSGYLDLLLNWYASVERLGYGSRVLFFAEEEDAFEFLHQRWPKQTVLVQLGVEGTWGRETGLPPGGEEGEGRRGDERGLGVEGGARGRPQAAQDFGSPSYNAMVNRRPLYLEALIRLNVTFLYNDVDVVWLRNPFPFFTGDFDMWVEEDWPRDRGLPPQVLRETEPHPAVCTAADYLCTCIMHVRPTPGSLALVQTWRDVLGVMQRRAGGKPVPNQQAFNTALHLAPPHVVRVGVLPLPLFPPGCVYFQCPAAVLCRKYEGLLHQYWTDVAASVVKPVMVHNNWIKGHQAKIKRFFAKRMWMADHKHVADLEIWLNQKQNGAKRKG